LVINIYDLIHLLL